MNTKDMSKHCLIGIKANLNILEELEIISYDQYKKVVREIEDYVYEVHKK